MKVYQQYYPLMSSESKIGLSVFLIALTGYVYSSFYAGFIEAVVTFSAMLVVLLSGYLFNKGKTSLRVIAVILNIYLLFLFFMPMNIKQGLNDLKKKEAKETI